MMLLLFILTTHVRKDIIIMCGLAAMCALHAAAYKLDKCLARAGRIHSVKISKN